MHINGLSPNINTSSSKKSFLPFGRRGRHGQRPAQYAQNCGKRAQVRREQIGRASCRERV